MKIFGQAAITGNGLVMSGYYAYAVSGTRKPKLFELSSPTYPIEHFVPPYDAILKSSALTGDNLIAVGRKIKSSSEIINSNRSGAFYFFDSANMIGACHGLGRDDLTFYSGYNFYNAFYPVGYFQPPFGETISVFDMNTDELDNLAQGACFQMSVTEYNEQFGIVSKVASDASASSSTLNPNSLAQIMSLKETCPDGTIAVSTYYDEAQVKRIAGTVTSITAPTLYNHNAIPTSLDNFDTWVEGRYQYSGDTPNKLNHITFVSGRPVANYSSTDTNHSKLNNTLCYAQLFETDTAIGRLTNGLQRIETPDVLPGNIGSQVSAAGQEPWHYWHFIFKENAETIPFASDFKQIRPGVTRRTISEGTQQFTPILSSEDAYWQNRQCPDTVDYLPWNFGASIYSCPSEHFDVPYYAAIKKFGFYGTRFLNSCTRLDLTETWSGVENALELTGPVAVPFPDVEPEGVETDGNWSFASYDNLLRVATAEERYSNMYALNKGFFLWANTGCIFGTSQWGKLSAYDGFSSAFSGMVLKFQDVYQNGLSSFISGEPSIIIQEGETTSSFSVLDSGKYADILFTNDVYLAFRKQVNNIITGDAVYYWQELENLYAYYVSNCNSGINSSFYNYINSGREKRIRTRFFENVVRGNPVDLFPINQITFATDLARNYLESTGWSRIPHSFGKSSDLPPINRRYFQGAYGNASSASGIAEIINALSMTQNASFYPGFFNKYGFGKIMPTPAYVPVLSGYIQDSSRRKFSPSGWLAVGYNEVGALDKNFSCFTPIITQQPLAKVFCKIGQQPTLRVTAVDYHSIPEDKISFRYPEIIYWTQKLKITNSQLTNNYPLSYRWFRVLKSSYSLFAATSDFNLAHFSDPNGDWCALEGDTSKCTIIHPRECFPVYTPNGTSVNDYTFIQGVKENDDDNYFYLCLVKGRFGIRISEPCELVVENWVRFDVSQKNGMNFPGQISIDFIINDIYGQDNVVTFTSEQGPAYAGYQRDPTAVPESVIEQKIPPPNAGFGDVSASRFIGPYGFVGATRTYAPDTLKDTRGLREVWGRLLDYGALIPLSKKLSQREGNLLYGYKHLPECENYSMPNGQKGVRVKPYVNGNLIKHWTLDQQAFASLDNTQAMKWEKLGHVGSLYPPAMNVSEITSPNKGIGHWQWGTNLGAVKRFGYLSRQEDNDLVLLGRGVSSSAPTPEEWLQKIKDKFIQGNTLAGDNCGYTRYGLGRNMLYYIEAFDRFYLICDPVKKKNVANVSFMCPGLRNTNSAIQYFWMGQPNNTYVERRAMFGPYAYQWRVRKHNRDRNGNGMSQGFYSPSYNTRYELMYDAPAIYGLYVKKAASSEYLSKVTDVNNRRRTIFNFVSDWGGFRNLWFGEAGSEGTSRRYGNFTFSCDETSWAYNREMCDYVSAAKELANNPDFRAYSCPEDRLKKGECFDPCLSIRYGQGFFPGGKAQTMFGYSAENSSNLNNKNLRLVASANFKDDALIVQDEPSTIDGNVFFRSPVNTPHARVWRGLMKVNGVVDGPREGIVGMSPCRDGGSDHCNYLTPTIHLDTSSSMAGMTSSFIASQSFAANVYQTYDIRGGD